MHLAKHLGVACDAHHPSLPQVQLRLVDCCDLPRPQFQNQLTVRCRRLHEVRLAIDQAIMPCLAGKLGSPPEG